MNRATLWLSILVALAWVVPGRCDPLWRLDVGAANLSILGSVLNDRGFTDLLVKGKTVGIGNPETAGVCVTGHLIDGQLRVAVVVDTLANEPLLHDSLNASCGPPAADGIYTAGDNGPYLTPRGRHLIVGKTRAAIASLPATIAPLPANSGVVLSASLADFPRQLRPQAAALQGVSTLRLTAAPAANSWNLQLALQTASADQAQQTFQIVNGLLAYAKINAEQQPQLARFAANAAATVEKDTVRVTVSTSAKALRDLLRKRRQPTTSYPHPVLGKP